MNAVAENIRILRQKNGMTQDGLAEKLDVTRQTVSNWETGKNEPDIDTLLKIADIFGADINTLTGSLPVEKYQRYQKKYIIVSSVCAFLLIVSIILNKTLVRYYLYIKGITYNPLPYTIVRFVVNNVFWITLGVIAPAFVSLFFDTRLREHTRRMFLIVGIITVLPILLSAISIASQFHFLFNLLYYLTVNSEIMYCLDVILGICLFMYINK